MSNFYSGSKLLLPLANMVNLKLDQINFIVCQIVSCFIGYYFLKYMSPDKVRPSIRHIFEITIGVGLTLFCFGSQIWYLLAQSIPVFIMINIFPLHISRHLILIFALASLSFAHIARMYYDYGSYTLDITGPLMIQTQKLSSLPFNIVDGERLKKNQPLRRQAHKLHAILRRVKLLDFFSYMFYFHGLMVGPFVFYADYLRFIEGTEHEVLTDDDEIEYFIKHKTDIINANKEKRFHFMALFIYSVLYMVIEPYVQPSILLGDYYRNTNYVIRYFMMTAVMFLNRQKYYLAWTTCAITNLFAGFGFSGFKSRESKKEENFDDGDDDKTSNTSWVEKERVPIYNIIKNFHVTHVEFGTSMKVMIEHWNVNTSLWLRECVYDRLPNSVNTIAVFACSAIWHGYYSGYYLAFASVAWMTAAARYGRRLFRPTMVKYNWLPYYNILTHVTSMFCLNFCILPFALLDISLGFQVWLSLYLLAPIVCTTIIISGLIHERYTKQSRSSTTGTTITTTNSTALINKDQ